MSRIAPDWKPDEPTSAYAAGFAKAAGIDAAKLLDQFRAYDFRDPPRDPNRVFRTWLTRAADYQTKQPNGNGSSASAETAKPQTKADRERAFIESFRSQRPRVFERLQRYMAQHRWWAGASADLQREEMVEAIRDRHTIADFLNEENRAY